MTLEALQPIPEPVPILREQSVKKKCVASNANKEPLCDRKAGNNNSQLCPYHWREYNSSKENYTDLVGVEFGKEPKLKRK